MPGSFEPLSAVPVESATAYLAAQGVPPEISNWKYFDPRPVTGERGYVWIEGSEVAGFLGLIPFTICRDGVPTPAAWTCDWSLGRPDLPGAMGILLLKHVLKQTSLPLYTLGGNENTHRIYARIADHATLDAGILMYLPLRAGALTRLFRQRMPPFLAPLNRIPLPYWSSPGPARSGVRIEGGIAGAIEPVLAAGGPGWRPRYDLQYLDWQIGRCPALDCFTCHAPGAAAVLWHARGDQSHWRMAAWSAGAPDALDSVIAATVRHVFESRGELLSAVVSRLDAAMLSALRAARFRMHPRRRALFGVSGGAPCEELRPLSFLDTDLAYRF